jgi:hypothetical protein
VRSHITHDRALDYFIFILSFVIPEGQQLFRVLPVFLELWIRVHISRQEFLDGPFFCGGLLRGERFHGGDEAHFQVFFCAEFVPREESHSLGVGYFSASEPGPGWGLVHNRR